MPIVCLNDRAYAKDLLKVRTKVALLKTVVCVALKRLAKGLPLG